MRQNLDAIRSKRRRSSVGPAEFQDGIPNSQPLSGCLSSAASLIDIREEKNF